MLAPVIDSVMTLGECCLGRPLCRGCPLGPDGDEALLCRLLADPSRLDRLLDARMANARAWPYPTRYVADFAEAERLVERS